MTVSSNPAFCTRVGDGYDIDNNGLPTPNICGSNFEFDNAVIPSEVDLSHCLGNNALVQPATGILCQPRCQSQYETTIPLPGWKHYTTSFCGTGTQSVKVELKKYNKIECQRYCEALPDCFYFAEHEDGNACDIWRANRKCTTLEGFDSRFIQDSILWTYDGPTSLGFTFFCNKDGTWRTKEHSDPQSATDFFARQCKVAPTTIPSTSTTTIRVAKAEVDEQTFEVHPAILILSALGIIVVVVVIIVVVVIRTRKQPDEDEKPRRQTITASEKEVAEVMKSPQEKEKCSENLNVALDVVDDVPT